MTAVASTNVTLTVIVSVPSRGNRVIDYLVNKCNVRKGATVSVPSRGNRVIDTQPPVCRSAVCDLVSVPSRGNRVIDPTYHRNINRPLERFPSPLGEIGLSISVSVVFADGHYTSFRPLSGK